MPVPKNKCKITKENLETIIANDEQREQEFEDNTQFVDVNKEFIADLKSELRDGTELNENQIEDYLGTLDERTRYLTKIYGLLSGTEIIEDMFTEYVLTHLPAGVRLADKKRNIDLRLFPIASLKLYYNKILTLTLQTNPRGKAFANFGGIVSAIRTPASLKWKDPTGAYHLISDATIKYPRRVSNRINKFITNVSEMKSIAKQFKMDAPRMSMEQITHDLKYLVSLVDPRKVQDLFHRHMMGWIYFDENDNFMVYQDYGKLLDENGYLRLHPDGDVMFGFSNPIALKDYEALDVGIEKGQWNVELVGESLAKFKKYIEEARKIDDLVFEYSKWQMNESLKELSGQLAKTFPLLSEKDIKLIFFKPDIRRAKEIIKGLNEKDMKQYALLRDVFATKISDEIVMVNGGRIDNTGGGPEYQNNHFPVLYRKPVYLEMLRKLIADFKAKMVELGDITKDVEASQAEKGAAIKLHALYRAKLNNARVIQDSYDGYHQDIYNDVLLNFAKDNKYFKRISNAYDVRSARTGDSVYYDYLKTGFSAIERNYLAAKLVHSLRISKSEAVNRAAINMFKIPFADPSVEGLFGTSVKSTADKMGKDPEKMERFLRKISSYLTGAYLGGAGTAATNFSAINQNWIDYGHEETMKALALYPIDEKGSIALKIQSIIQQSGIVEFSEFFSRSMVNGVIGVQLENDISDHVIGGMIFYHDNIRKYGEKKAREIFNRDVGPILAQSKLWMSVAELEIPEKERLKMRAKELKSEKIQIGLNKFVQFSIEREYEFKHALKGLPIKKFIKEYRLMGIAGTAGAVVGGMVGGPLGAVAGIGIGTTVGNKQLMLKTGNLYRLALKKFKISMSDTERYIRTISFIIAANRAWEGGLLNKGKDGNLNWWEYTDQKDIAEVIEIGALLSEATNFGLSSQSVGRIGHGGFGKLMVKFKNWSMQKFGRDTRILHEWYSTMKSLEKTERRHPGRFKSWSPKALLKTFGSVFTSNKTNKQVRITNPAAATGRDFIWKQGFLTFLWDFFIAGPIKIPILTRHIFQSVMGRSTRNMTSDLLSLMMMPFVILARLAIPGLWDEDEAERTITYYMRRTMLGYVPMTMWDFLMSANLANKSHGREAWDKLPLFMPPGIQTIVKEIIKAAIKKDKKKRRGGF